jgi:hypothetical protein
MRTSNAYKSEIPVDLYPVTGKKITAAAQSAGFNVAPISVLLVEGDNKPGLGYAIAGATSDAGINAAFLAAQVVGKRYSAVFGCETDEDTRNAAVIMRKAVARKKK